MKMKFVMLAAMLASGAAFAEGDKKPGEGGKPRHHGPPPMEKLDTNKDGKVSFEEFKAGAPKDAPAEKVEAKFKKLDANGDGSITKDEFAAMRPKDGDRPHGEKGDKRGEK